MRAWRKIRCLLLIIALGILATGVPSCGTAPTQAPPVPTVAPTPTPIEEDRLVELEWPAQMRMDSSDIIRLALVPTKDGYAARAEFPDHALQTKEVTVPRPGGYDLYAIARLDGVGFTISPEGDQERLVPPGEEVAWRWSLRPNAPGPQRLSVQLRLRWTPVEGSNGRVKESLVLGRGLEIQVRSLLGMAPGQAALVGSLGLLIGCACLLLALFGDLRFGERLRLPPRGAVEVAEPDPSVAIETPPDLSLPGEDRALLQALFDRRKRLLVEQEFHSGYSGARTLLVRPIRADDCADAPTIVKIGPHETIRREFENYGTFVKDRLPPVTARIQRPPVRLRSGRQMAIQYTFIAEPGRSPLSLHQALLQNPDPEYLLRLFDTFGPNWWMQRRPSTFRLAQEYDRLLPPHVILRPLAGGQARTETTITELDDPSRLELAVGDVVRVQPFRLTERRGDGRSYTLVGMAGEGSAALRVRWLESEPPRRATAARVVANRQSLLNDLTAGLDLFDLPDPRLSFQEMLNEVVVGTRSVIHGDLNLQNVLVGPGNLVWLIDFAQTREGHPLFDFAHLEAEVIAHVLAEKCASPEAFLEVWRSGEDPLVTTLRGIARRCSFDPESEREYELALFMSCLGALKYGNLTTRSRHCLLLAAAEVAGRLREGE